MKEQLIALLERIKEDAGFIIYHFDAGGRFKMESQTKDFVLEKLAQNNELTMHTGVKEIIMLSEMIGVRAADFIENISYETSDIEGYIEYISKYNPYHKIYIRLKKDTKTIEFKLGDKYKLLELMEEGFSGFVSKPYKNKYLRCVSAESLEEHIQDKSWNPRMVEIGRKILKINPKIKFPE